MEVEKGLLLHWWHYYGKGIYTLAELDEFEKIIDKYGIDKVVEAAGASYITDDGSPTVMLECIRRNYVDELFATLPDIEKMNDKEKKMYNDIRDEFISIILKTYS